MIGAPDADFSRLLLSMRNDFGLSMRVRSNSQSKLIECEDHDPAGRCWMAANEA